MAQTFGSDFILTLQFMARELWWCFRECHAALFCFTSYSDTLLMKRIKTCIVFLEISPWTIQCLRKFLYRRIKPVSISAGVGINQNLNSWQTSEEGHWFLRRTTSDFRGQLLFSWLCNSVMLGFIKGCTKGIHSTCPISGCEQRKAGWCLWRSFTRVYRPNRIPDIQLSPKGPLERWLESVGDMAPCLS